MRHFGSAVGSPGARVPSVSLPRAFGRRAIFAIFACAPRKCVYLHRQTTSDGRKMPYDGAKIRLFEPLEIQHLANERASNVVRVIMSTCVGTSSGHVANSVQNGSFVVRYRCVKIAQDPEKKKQIYRGL